MLPKDYQIECVACERVVPRSRWLPKTAEDSPMCRWCHEDFVEFYKTPEQKRSEEIARYRKTVEEQYENDYDPDEDLLWDEPVYDDRNDLERWQDEQRDIAEGLAYRWDLEGNGWPDEDQFGDELLGGFTTLRGLGFNVHGR